MLLYLLFVIGFILLIKGADFLVDGASSLAKRLQVSDLIIGLTIVAFGTSAPELVVNIIASFQGNPEIAIGNILGSNIINILIILGLSAIVYPLMVTKDTVWKEIPLSLFSVLLLAFLVNDALFLGSSEAVLSSIDGIILLSAFAFFLYYVFRSARSQRNQIKPANEIDTKTHSSLYSALLIVIGLIGINIGAKWVVDGAIEIAHVLKVSESLIALTIVALGTSLPELVTSVIAALKKNCDIAVGNIVGSNIFNVLLILGISSLVRPLPFTGGREIDVAMVILATLLLFISMFTGKPKHCLERWEGILFISVYIVYISFLVIRG